MKNKAMCQVSSSVQNGILEIVFKGVITDEEFPTIENEVIETIKSTRTGKVLMDIREAKRRVGYAETYFIVRNFPPDRPVSNIAVVDNAENADYGSFLENTAFNAGLIWKIFTDIDAARTWLNNC